MNERIAKLANQAGFDVDSTGKFGNYSEMHRVEKFAELIVRECLECGDKLAKHYIDTHTEKEQSLLLASIADYSSEIKKHFGVEE